MKALPKFDMAPVNYTWMASDAYCYLCRPNPSAPDERVYCELCSEDLSRASEVLKETAVSRQEEKERHQANPDRRNQIRIPPTRFNPKTEYYPERSGKKRA